MAALLEVKNLSSSVEGKPILGGINLVVNKGEAHVIMGPNGSGKSTLALCVMGHPSHKIEEGEIFFENKKLNSLKPDERAKLGIFLGFQNPLALEGVSFFSLMQSARNAPDIFELRKNISEKFLKLGLADDFIMRGVNDGASGGERKKLELAQMQMLEPKLAIFDEIDTGLDVDALKKIGEEIADLKNKGTAVILITHYQRILNYVRPDKVHIMMAGRIVKSGGTDLAEKINESGYSYLKCPIENAQA
ncbi:MAG: Fe-S cluster assembly ATPase SufC [Patescibacteria group bacterium]